MSALPDAITTSDTPPLKEAFSRPENSEWFQSIEEELSTLSTNGIWKSGNPARGVYPLTSGIIIKLKTINTGNQQGLRHDLWTLGTFNLM